MHSRYQSVSYQYPTVQELDWPIQRERREQMKLYSILNDAQNHL